MSTPALICVYEDDMFDEFPLMCIYKHWDGGIESTGKFLADNFGDFKIVPGISASGDHSKEANGMGCLAAQIVAKLKDGIGDVYITHYDGDLKRDVVYAYHIYLRNDELRIWVDRLDLLVYDNPISKFGEWIDKRGE